MGCRKKNIFAFATACIRGAQNRDIILHRAEQISKLKISLLDGKEEAELCFAGAAASIGCPSDGVLADLGGGSCEFVRFIDGSIVRSVSLNVGALVMHKRFSSKKHLTAPESRELSAFLCDLFAKELAPFSNSSSLHMVVTGGSARAAVKLISTLYNVDPTLPFEISNQTVDSVTKRFFNGEISNVYESVLNERSQTLIPALFVFKEASKALGTDRFTVIEGGARLGLASRILSKK
jgi:exopolyphosphatase/guanosine-5'-triphosphate,3'-diphosphate pyrophosphatase